MKVLKGFTLGLLSFLLFVSLCIFGLAFTLNKTVLSPKWITTQLNTLDVSTLVEEVLNNPAIGQFPGEMKPAIIDTVTRLEPDVKKQTNTAIYLIYDYLNGKNETLELKLTLKNTLLNKDFVTTLINKLDIYALTTAYLEEQFSANIPPDQQQLVKYFDSAAPKLEPWIEQQAGTIIGSFLDYILGESQNLNVVIPLDSIKPTLKSALREAFMQSPPSELTGATQAQLGTYFNQYYHDFATQMPSTLVIDKSIIGTNIQADFAKALADAESKLKLARQVIGYFQFGYTLLIAFIAVLVLGIILTSHEVRTSTRILGILFIAYGALWYASVWVARFAQQPKFVVAIAPPSLQAWLFPFIDSLLHPLEMFSLGCLIGGIVLLVVSYVYKPRPTLS
jgi:hypothetical protein